jgi:aspartyl protease family protein
LSGGGDQALSFIYLIGCLMLVGSSLLVRRLPIGQSLKMLAAWALIFAAIFTAFLLKDDFLALGRRVMAEGSGSAQTVQTGTELRIRKSEDGHFWVSARVNGKPVRFLVDSGATVTAISGDTAREVGIEPSGAFPVMVDTANGTVSAWRGRASSLKVGPIERQDFAVQIADEFGDTSVLGMNFLSSLSSWSVEGNWLVLKA